MTAAAANPLPDFSAFDVRLAGVAAAVEAELADLLGAEAQPGEIVRPERLMAAIRHAALGGGKRLRPFLVMETAAALGAASRSIGAATEHGILRAAVALEMVHCYSLVHDDLPAMDDDDLRRGQPTVHRAFDEATAILAGDALLTLAFEVLADEATAADATIRLGLISGLARAAGMAGMVGGQMLDLAAEGRYAADRRPLALDDRDIRRLQAMKTGALLQYACEAGAILVGADAAGRAMAREYGRLIGEAFQIADDLIDLESLPEEAGKATGKDAARGKATLIGLHGAEAMRQELDRLTEAAIGCLAPLGAKAEMLKDAARFIACRTS